MTRHRRHRRRAVAALTLTGLLAVTAACGDDDSGDDDTAATTATSSPGGEAVGSTSPDDGSTDATGATGSTVSSEDEPATTSGDATATTVGELAADAEGYTTAIAAYLQSSGGVALEAEQAECAAPGWVEVITLERFESSGQTPDDIAAGTLQTVDLGLDEGDGQQLLDALTGCEVEQRGLFMSSVSPDLDVECIDRELSDESIEQLLREALVNTEPSEQLSDEIDRVGEACGLDD
jgi:hypothetical protein